MSVRMVGPAELPIPRKKEAVLSLTGSKFMRRTEEIKGS